jgi:ABC-type branched-subunit amino acid transport system substrate-binding protein
MRAIARISMALLAALPLWSHATHSVGYGFADSVLPAKNQELFYMGFETGFEKILGLGAVKKYVVLERTTGGAALGAQRAADALITKFGVALMVGFPTSHEALLAGRVASAKGVPAIFAGAGHSDLAKMGDMVFTTGESMAASVENMLSFISKNEKGKKGLVISNPRAVFSIDQETAIKARMAKNPSVKLDFLHLGAEQQIPADELNKLANKEYAFLFFTPYADEIAKSLEQLEGGGIDLPIYTNSSWTTGDVEFIRRFISKKMAPVYSASLWAKDEREWKVFEKAIIGKFGRTPTSEMSYGYDLGVIAGRIIKSIKGETISVATVKAAIARQRCFSETSSGRICFPLAGGHANRSIHVVKFTKNGFIGVGQ